MAINRKKKLTRQHKRQGKEELPANVKQLNNFLEDTIFAPLISLLEKKSNLKAKDEIEVMNLSEHPAISNALTAYRLLDRGVHFLEDGMYDEAVNSLNDSAKLIPDAPYTHFTLARAYELMGRENEAIREFSEFVRLAPLNPGGYYFLGAVLMRQRRYKEAVLRFREVIQLYDKFENTKLEADDEFTAIVLKDEAKELIYKYSKILGNYAEGLLRLSNGEYEEAEKNFLHSNDIIQEGKISELHYFLVLARIPKVDEKIKKLGDSRNFAELRKLAKSLSIEIWRILKKTDAETQPFYPLILCKFIYVTFLLNCLLPGFKQNFIRQLSESGFPEEGVKETEKLLFDSESAKKFMKKVNLVDAKQFLNSLDTFSIEVKKYPTPDDVSLEKQQLLIKSLVPLSNAVDGQSTESATTQMLLTGQDKIKVAVSKTQKMINEFMRRGVGSDKVKTELEGEKLEYEIWESKKGWRPASFSDIMSIKKDKKIIFLLDEDTHIYVRGKDKTNFFKKKKITYLLLKYFLQNRGSSNIEDVFRKWWRIKHKGKGFPSYRVITTQQKEDIKRTIRHLNDTFHELDLKEELFLIGNERFCFPSDMKQCWIKRKTSETESQ